MLIHKITKIIFKMILKFFSFFNFLVVLNFLNFILSNFSVVYAKDFILEPVLMFFSNSPEYVLNNGYLISGYISSFTPTLIYFYHVNNSEVYKELVIRFHNDSNSINKFNEVYIDGIFSSSRNNYFKVGKDLNSKMLKDFKPCYLEFENEYIIKVPFKPYELLSGFIWIFSNNGLYFDSFVSEDNNIYRFILKPDNKHVKGIFGISRILTYLPNNQDLIVGDIPLEGIEANMLLKGTYKVMYHFIVKRDGEIYFNPRGGPSRPSFVIYNIYSSFYYTEGKVFKEYTENKLLDKDYYIREFLVIPEGASYYPVRYFIK